MAEKNGGTSNVAIISLIILVIIAIAAFIYFGFFRGKDTFIIEDDTINIEKNITPDRTNKPNNGGNQSKNSSYYNIKG